MTPIGTTSDGRHGFERRTVISGALRGNPLGDPTERDLWVYLPPGYRDTDRRYPTIYVITGFTGSVDSWWAVSPFRPSYPEMIRSVFEGADPARPALVVLVDAWTALGGSQYLNSPGTGQYLDYLCDDVVGFVDSTYRTMPQARHRALAGKSSGGYGAMVVPMLRPDVFGGLASHAGDAGFEFCYLQDVAYLARLLRDRFDCSTDAFLADFRAKASSGRQADIRAINAYAMAACYSAESDGSVTLPVDPRTGRLRDDVWQRWLAFDPVRMAVAHAETLRSMRAIWLDAGRSDDYFLDLGMTAFADQLRSLSVDHRVELFDGTHAAITWRYPMALRYLADRLTLDG